MINPSRDYNSRSGFNGPQGNNVRASNQFRYSSASTSRNKSQGKKLMPKTDGFNNKSVQKKSVKFADLTDQEMAQLRSEGKCFLCKEVGHMSQNCPHKHVVKGNGKSKPPGVPSYSMEMEIVENDTSDEILDSMSVERIYIHPDHEAGTDDWREWYPDWQLPQAPAREEIGNCYVMTAEYILTIQQPYPGDDPRSEQHSSSPHNRFQVIELINDAEKNFSIVDYWTNFTITIEKERIANPKFNIGHWYATKRARTLKLRRPAQKEYPTQLANPIVLVATHLLQSGINTYFPNTRTSTWMDDRFFIYLKDYGSTTYIIVDDDLKLTTEIDLNLLEDPKFNLIQWYLAKIRERNLFHQSYIKYHEKRFHYCDRDMIENSGLKWYISVKTIMTDMANVLERCAPYPGDNISNYPVDITYKQDGSHRSRFNLDVIDLITHKLLYVYDRQQGFDSFLLWDIAIWNRFSIGKWYAEQCAINQKEDVPTEVAREWIKTKKWSKTTLSSDDDMDDDTDDEESNNEDHDENGDAGEGADNVLLTNLFEKTACTVNNMLMLNGVQVDRNKYVSVQRNAARIKDMGERLMPKPIVIKVAINGVPVRALVDSGSLGDFISSTLVDQLKLKRINWDKPLGLQLAVQGSRSKINSAVNVNFSYQNIKDSRHFDVINLNDYDVILGTPWIYQHQVCIGLNPARIVIGSDVPLPIASGTDTKYLLGAAALLPDDEILQLPAELMSYAEPLCCKVEETELPPFRAINHTIPLIDEQKVYQWRPSKCPEVFRSQWNEKRDAYIKSGRWKMTTARNTVPMLLIHKPHKPKNAPELRTVIDLRERNKNTVKMSSPLPDIEGVLRRVTAKPFRSVLDLTAAYEQIRIIPEHVERSAVTTPDGNMVSLVLQMGDCNAPASWRRHTRV